MHIHIVNVTAPAFEMNLKTILQMPAMRHVRKFLAFIQKVWQSDVMF